MNGRLYDPYLQRFLSPDIYVQSPTDAQNYNRYSYCLNNPLMYTDPSGWTARRRHEDEEETYINGFMFYNAMNRLDGVFGYSGGGVINYNIDYDDAYDSYRSQGKTGSFNDFLSDLKENSHESKNSIIIEETIDFYLWSTEDWGKTWTRGSFLFSRTNKYEILKPSGGGVLYSIADQRAAFNSMWNASYDKNGNQLENNAWLTTKGVLVLPNNKNTAGNCSFDYLPYSQKNGKWYVTFNNQDLEIIGTFHTHPGGKEYDWINGYDNDTLKQFGAIFVLSDYHLLYSNGTSQQELTTNKTFLQNGLWGCGIPGFK